MNLGLCVLFLLKKYSHPPMQGQLLIWDKNCLISRVRDCYATLIEQIIRLERSVLVVQASSLSAYPEREPLGGDNPPATAAHCFQDASTDINRQIVQGSQAGCRHPSKTRV